MPIVDVDLVLGPAAPQPPSMPPNQPPPLPPGLAARLADELGRALDQDPGRTWVRLHSIANSAYAEHGSPTPDPPPVFVRLTRAAVPSGVELHREIDAVVRAVSRCCDRPVDRVHVEYAPPAAGRIAFGGRLVPPRHP